MKQDKNEPKDNRRKANVKDKDATQQVTEMDTDMVDCR